MRGKVGLVIGLAAGYVLGARAGRERYEQIKEQADKVWHLDPVQKQVAKVQDLGKSALLALPTTIWNSAVKVTKAATTKGTPGERLDAAIDAGEEAKGDVEEAAETSKKAAEDTAKKAEGKVKETAEKVGDKAEDLADKTGDKVEEAAGKAEDVADKAGETAKKATSRGSSGSSRNSSSGK